MSSEESDATSVTSVDTEDSALTNNKEGTSSYLPSLVPKDCYAFDDDDSSCSDCSFSSALAAHQFNSIDECLEFCTMAQLVRGHSNSTKRRKVENEDEDLRPIAFVRINTRRGKLKPTTIRALLDSGASETLLHKKFAKKLRVHSSKNGGTNWSTPGGRMTTDKKAKIQFTLPELHDDRLIEWNAHVANDLGNYDMIIGRDILDFLSIDLRFSTKEVEWDHCTMPFN